MNLYDKELTNNIASFKQTIQCLTDNKFAVDRFEKLIQVIKDNGIACDEMISLHPHTQTVSFFLFPMVDFDTFIIQAMHITAAFLEIDVDKIKPNLDINHCVYGFEMPMNDGNSICISLNKLKQFYSSLDIERILNDVKTTVPATFFIGVDIGSNDQTVIAYRSPEATASEVAA